MELPQLDHVKMASLVPITMSSGSVLGHESVSHVINDYDGCVTQFAFDFLHLDLGEHTLHYLHLA